ncbi:quinoprotein glucose dehydrogenase, partial [archaeon]|nr:quinoprotein glucose dehydrogenase [archaeon]
SRYILENQRLVNETILLDDIPSARFHDGGRIKFGPDGKLYITTGDATDLSSAQNLNSLAGKILRMNKDGSIPKDNPFQNYVYSYGHRNPQGLAWDNNQQLFSSEHGPTRNDEFNKIVMGKNYGWPQQCDQTGNFINPVRCFTEFTLAPGSLAFHKGDFFVTGLRGKQLRKLRLDLNKVQNEQVVLSDLGRIREVVSHKGDLYVGTSNRDGRGLPKVQDDKIIKLQIVN